MAAAAGGAGGGSTPPNLANIVPITYNFSGIVFAKATDANLAVAKKTNSTASELTDIFSPVTLATGKIITASTSSAVIQGSATEFLTDFENGDYLFYYDSTATPFLIGRIQTRNSNTQITLTGNSSVTISTTPTSGQLYPTFCGKTSTIIGLNESVVMRVPVFPYGQAQAIMPNWNKFRLQSQPSSYNNPANVSIVTYSAINNPTGPGTSQNISFTITAATDFTYVSTGAFRYTFLNATVANGGFPTFVYAILNPYGDSTVDSLPPNTLYRLFANENFNQNGILVSPTYPELFLQASGY